MPQVSLYVDEQTLAGLREDASREGTSLSKHVTARLKNSGRCATPSGLPEGLLERLYGCLADDESFTRPDQPDFALDAPRLSFD